MFVVNSLSRYLGFYYKQQNRYEPESLNRVWEIFWCDENVWYLVSSSFFWKTYWKATLSHKISLRVVDTYKII